MPDIAAPRPVSGSPIETAWGQEVHDDVESIQTGTVTIAGIVGSATATAAVVFPRPYVAVPLIFTASQATSVTPGWQGQTTTGFNAIARRNDGSGTATTQTIHWMAIGVLA